ncbi:extracellular solute-binding protein family 1 [Paenibacillus curdlanolyticus YK9]|uniref:Extracellular solute-binding protein family 1 n=1 Tax=Paenibacillus curdlanolyticus YK9 TaxID=717606 RepID=E0IEX3_9BACL|nr:extracellular solute-binding protein [Paenibacillus curdlanolyticus]EFM09211.1 extracellular solute-binding protein family 1 [Paenibacillus curdlanolyticus YK9]
MRKSLKWMNLALAGALTLSLAACGSSSKEDENKGTETGTETTPKAENVTITFQNIYPDPETPSYKIMKQIVDQYTKDHPNVKIELDSLNTDQQKLKLKTQAASKEVPDITIVNPAAQMKPFVDAGLLAPLNDMLEKDDLKGTFQEGILDFYSFDNNTYALPDGNNVAVVFYNKKLFEQAGAKVPTTFDELLADVKLLKDKGITPLVIGEKDTWTGSFLFMNTLLRTNGGPGFLKDVVDGKKTFNDPAFESAVANFEKLVQAGAFQDGATSMDYNAGENLFKTGKSAMYFMGTWATGAIDASSVGPDVGVFQFPTVDGKGDPNEYMLAPGSAFAISANSKHLQETKDFLHYFMQQYPKVSFDMKNAVTVAQKVDGDFKAAGYSDLQMEVAALKGNVKGGDLSFDNTMNPSTSQVHLTSIQNLFVQQVDPKAVAKEHQTAFESNK